MNYRIENRDAFIFFGSETVVSTVDNHNNIAIPKFWETCRTNGTMKKIRDVCKLDDNTPLHAALYNCKDDSHSYMIGYFSPRELSMENFATLSVPAATWAVFTTEELSLAETGNQAQILWKRIFTEWFAISGYELANAPEMELHYGQGNGLYLTEIWIPIVNK